MTRPRQAPRDAADAALQLSLPLFDALRRAEPKPVPGRRLVRLEQQIIEYQLTRSQRRTIGFLVDDRGLSVTAPRWVTLACIEQALAEKARWILRKLDEWRQHAARRARLAIQWEDGADLPFLGSSLRMQRVDAARVAVRREDQVLWVGLPEDAGPDAFRDAVQHWVRQQAIALFEERLAHYARLLGQGPSRWALSSARTRWGSCGPDGAIRLNWRLMFFPPHIIDYVVAHELAHLKELNHSRRFWDVVGQIYPDYSKARAWLRSYPDDLALN
ncbi:MAG: SprT family zinc-dependent metalloprotease [Burkholderiaceae bacterium]